MIFRKEKVKDLPTLIFLMIFDFWAGTVWEWMGRGACKSLPAFFVALFVHAQIGNFSF